MTLLEIINKICDRQAIPATNSVIASTNTQIKQLKELLEEELEDLSSRHNWQSLTKIVSHTTINAEDQGSITSIAGGYDHISNSTMWDQSGNLPIFGPLNGQQWQELKSLFSNGPRFQYRIVNNHLLINPIPSAGLTFAFEAYTKYPIIASDGLTTKEYFTADDDVHPEEIRNGWHCLIGGECLS